MRIRPDTRIARTVTALAVVVSAVILLALPAAYFLFGYRYTVATLNTEAEINGRLVSQIVNSSPDLWRFQSLRIESLLARRPDDGTPEIRRVVDGSGELIAEKADPLHPPWLTRHASIYDSGQRVGELQIARSMRPLLLETVVAVMIAGLIAIAVFAVVRALPLRALQRALMELGAERAHSERLQQERDRAATEAQLKSQFLARMSHEIRTPMNGVLGMTELLLSSSLSERQRTFTETAHRSGRALLKIIDDILDFSKIEAGKLELEDVLFSPFEVAEDVVQALARRAYGKGLDIGALIAPDVPELVRGDPGRTRQVLTNLVGNAIKFTECGEVCVALSLQAGVSDGDARLRFEVRDTGIGIASAALARMFEPFTQADSSISRRFGGTGLGLAISRHLASAMGGGLSVTSKEGTGSTFAFTLPVADATTPMAPTLIHAPRIAFVHGTSLGARAAHDALHRLGAAPEAYDDVDRVLDALRAAGRSASPYRLLLLGPDCGDERAEALVARIKSECGPTPPQLVRLRSMAGSLDLEAQAQPAPDVLPLPVTTAELRALLLRCGAVGAAVSTPAPPSTGSHGLRGRRALLVEDNQVNQLVAMSMLESLGIQTEIAGDGTEALASLEQGSFDVVLMDCHMPGMDGFEATRRIRTREAARGGRQTVIALTANAFTEDRARCIDAGMDDFLAKPFTRDALKDMMQRWTSQVG